MESAVLETNTSKQLQLNAARFLASSPVGLNFSKQVYEASMFGQVVLELYPVRFPQTHQISLL